MEIVFNSFLPEEDELLESWIYRLAEANCIDFNELINMINHSDKKSKRFNLPTLLETISLETQCSKFINENTLIPFYSFFKTREVIDKMYRYYLQGKSNETNNKNPDSHSSTVFVCRECLKEDPFPYIHRMHNLPGIRVCPKHGTKLHICNDFFSNSVFTLGDELEVDDIEVEKEKASIATKILNSGVITNKNDVLKVLGVSDADIYFKRWEFNKIWQLINGKSRALDRIISELELDEKALTPIIPNQFKLLNGDGQIWKLKHKRCGNEFYSTPTSFASGYQCPFCDEQLSDDAFTKKVIESMYNAEYSYDSSSDVSTNNLIVKHKKCNHHSQFKLNKFLTGKCQCLCNRDEREEVYDIIDSWGDYSIHSYNNRLSPIVIRHNPCGAQFKFADISELKKPECICNQKKDYTSAEADQLIFENLGEEFELLSKQESYDKNDVIEYKHVPCGQVFYGRFSDFVYGAYCAECELLKNLDKLKSYVKERSNGRYEIVDDDLYHPGQLAIRDVVYSPNNFIFLKPSRIVHELSYSKYSTVLPIASKKSYLNPVYARLLNIDRS